MDDANVASQSTSKDFTGANPYDKVMTPTSGATSSTPIQSQPVVASDVLYAGFWRRFGASFIDWVLVGVANRIVWTGFSVMGEAGRGIGSILTIGMSFSYYVYFTSQRGRTPGKQLFGLRVQNELTGQNLDVISTILREVVGKFISALVLCLGYFWMLWDDKKQTWHDKIAKSVVVKV